MYITRKPPTPISITYGVADGFEVGVGYIFIVYDDHASELFMTSGMINDNDIIGFELPDYFIRYDGEYRLEAYVMNSYPDPVILGDLVLVDNLTIQRPYVDPALLIESPSELEEATQYEALARAVIDSITGGFKYEREVFETTGLGADYIPSPVRINRIIRVYENDICVYDTESTDPEWTNAKEYRISPDRSAITVRVSGNGGYNRYQSRPIRIHNSQSDSFTPYNLDMASKEDYVSAGDNMSFFPKGWDYVVVVDAGWPVIPHDIQTATKMLYNDLKCNNLPYLNSYIKEYESGQFTLKFDAGAFTKTGNAMVDQILSNYPRTLGRIGVL